MIIHDLNMSIRFESPFGCFEILAYAAGTVYAWYK